MCIRDRALIALGGADFSPTINGEPVPSLHPIIVNKNDILQFHKPIAGARVYLAIAGGISVKSWMDSRSTNLKAKVGGFNGRKLQKDDHVSVSYTHLRAHETVLDLVCRLLLEKKKTHPPPHPPPTPKITLY